MGAKLKMTKRTIKGYEIIDIAGDISPEASHEMVKFVKKIASGKEKDLFINLEGVNHMNSSALSVIVQAVRALATKKYSIYFMNVNERIMTLIKVAGLHNFFKFMSDEAALLERIDKERKA